MMQVNKTKLLISFIKHLSAVSKRSHPPFYKRKLSSNTCAYRIMRKITKRQGCAKMAAKLFTFHLPNSAKSVAILQVNLFNPLHFPTESDIKLLFSYRYIIL